MSSNQAILLTTLNARYIHASLGLRYLLANMGDLRRQTRLIEFTIDKRAIDIVEDLLSHNPAIIGLGTYIWNAEETCQVVRLIKEVSPGTVIILGGPEVSYEFEQQDIIQYADYVIPGQADLAFAETCRSILNKQKPLDKIIKFTPPSLADIQFPYAEYTDEDIKNRVIYVEASRGCPFKCEFCLSSLDKTAYPYELDSFLQQMQSLYERGVRSFKFIDRTFNLKIDNSIRILNFFLDKMKTNDVYLHFELIPDHLPEKIKQVISIFPEHSLQFEIGVQTFTPEVQKNISRKQDTEKTLANIRWLRNQTHAHLHTDLIIGLPGESLEQIAASFNQLVSLNPHEIQVGILKRLRGTPIIRHSEEYDIHYSSTAPYEILCNKDINFTQMQQLKRFARYWDMIANSGRFKHSKAMILGNDPFNNFLQLSNWLYRHSQQTHNISLPRMFSLLYTALTTLFKMEHTLVEKYLHKDFQHSGIKGPPKFLPTNKTDISTNKRRRELRQKRHRH